MRRSQNIALGVHYIHTYFRENAGGGQHTYGRMSLMEEAD